jgi:predicted outer membrane repeat protein
MAVITGSEFTNNSAGAHGGAISASAFEPSTIVLSLTNCTLKGNHAVEAGGAIASIKAASLYLSECTINDTNQTTGAAPGEGFGGGVYIKNTASATILNTTIEANRASVAGGGVYVKDSDLTMNGGRLNENRAVEDGGGFYIDAPEMTVTLNTHITRNTATKGKGGGGYLVKGTLTGSLRELLDNQGARNFSGIGAKAGQTIVTLTIPGKQQAVAVDS